MELIIVIAGTALFFGLCYLVDKGAAKAFRNSKRQKSGMAVRASGNNGIFGAILSALGILSIIVGISWGVVLVIGGVIVLLMGLAMLIHYLTFGIFYDGESFHISGFGQKKVTCYYRDIRGQKLYVVTGGNMIIELHMADGTAVSLQSYMDGVSLFLDTAFAGWCLATGRDPESCDFHDPAKYIWFPDVEEV